MSWTKRELIIEAFAELGYTDYDFDLEAEQLETALSRLDSLMSYWNTAKGIRLGYPLPSSKLGSSLDQDSNLPDIAFVPVYTNLALRIAPVIGKIVSLETRSTARDSLSALMGYTSQPGIRQLRGDTPLGSGNGRPDKKFVDPPIDYLQTGPDGPLEF